MSALEKRSSGDLTTLAVSIRREHEACEAAFGKAVAHAVEAGRLLLDAKSQLRHGEWLPWLESNFPATARTAQNYMRLADHAEDAQRVSHLGVAGALRQLAAPGDTESATIEAEIEAKVREFEREALSKRGNARLTALEAKIIRADETIKAGASGLLEWSEAVGGHHPALAVAAQRWAHLLLADPSPFELVDAKAEARAGYDKAKAEAGLEGAL